MPYFKLFNGGKQEVKNKFNQIHLRNGQVKEYEDIFRNVEFDDGFLAMNSTKCWAVVSLSTGKEISDYIYSDFNPILITNRITKNGFACSVCNVINSKWGILNSKGKEIISCCYDSCKVITPDYAIVKQNGRFGVINKKNELIVPIEYTHITQEVLNGYFIVSNKSESGIYDLRGIQIVPCKYNIIYRSNKNNWLVEDKCLKYKIYDCKGTMINENASVENCYKQDDETDNEVFYPINLFKHIVKPK